MTSLDRLIALDAVARLGAHDATLFSANVDDRIPIMQRLGWTDLASKAAGRLPLLASLAETVHAEGATDVLLLGMGGSSLAPLVIERVIGGAPGHPQLHVVDTTSPMQVRRLLAGLNRETTHVIVSSKSGTTIETRSLYAIIHDWLTSEGMSKVDAGRRCIVITDPGSPLEKVRQRDLLRMTLPAPATVGGRFSALSVFGLAPAAIVGVNLPVLVESAIAMERACSAPAPENPAALLAAWIADAREAGRDKLTLVCSEPLRPFGLWLAQLIAESLGKNGDGLIPVLECGLPSSAHYGPDRAIVVFRYADDAALEAWPRESAPTHPAYEIVIADSYDIGGEFVRWEYATALLGALAGVNPFDEPDVTAAKHATDAILDGGASEVPSAQADERGTWITFAGGLAAPSPAPETRVAAIRAALASARPGDYLALLAYAPDGDEDLAPLRSVCASLSAATGLPVCLEAGPRYLHSTGQLHKGGPDTGVFILITGRDRSDMGIPGRLFTLATLHRAQAEGDLMTLADRGRRVLRLDLPATDTLSLAELASDLLLAAE